MLETMGISGYMQAVKLKPSPARKNANKLVPRVSHERVKGLPVAGVLPPPEEAGARKRSLPLGGGWFSGW